MNAPYTLELALLDADSLAALFDHLRGFVDELRGDDIEVPTCWYVHGWTVRRLAALLRWQRDLSVPPMSGRAAGEWWTSGLAPLLRDWEPLQAHRGAHPPADAPWDDPLPVPPLEEVVAAHTQRHSVVEAV